MIRMREHVNVSKNKSSILCKILALSSRTKILKRDESISILSTYLTMT